MTLKNFVWRNLWAGGVGGGVPWFIVLLSALNGMRQRDELGIGSFFQLLAEPVMLLLAFVCVLLGTLWGVLSGLLIGTMYMSDFGGYSSRDCWRSMSATAVLSALANCLILVASFYLVFGSSIHYIIQKL